MTARTEWIVIALDPDGNVAQRAIAFGRLQDVAASIDRDSFAEHTGFEIGAVIISAPSMSPDELSKAVAGACALRFDGQGYGLPQRYADAWQRPARARPAKPRPNSITDDVAGGVPFVFPRHDCVGVGCPTCAAFQDRLTSVLGAHPAPLTGGVPCTDTPLEPSR